ncbi:MAG TPA: molybdenum cofactor guanylyltransferase [Terriglobales bacterium]|nr:molybdenum cofactor guanylyltransferase [Terriglobales bacterium]
MAAFRRPAPFTPLAPRALRHPSNVRYHVGVGSVTAFVLAGGQSSRMGSDKALLTFHDQTLLVRAMNTAAAVAGRVVIVGPRERYATYGEVVEDVYAGCGPLGGIHAALSGTETDLNLVLSVDMPLMTAQFLEWLLERARNASEWIVVPDALGGQQPLCAVYRRPVHALAEQALKAGDYKIGHLFACAPTLFISETEIREAGFSPEIFRNVNTAEEFETVVRDQSATMTGREG